MWEDYVWILVATSLLAFFTSFGIGANDVANAFATSVGAKSVTLPQAILIASIFEFSGALLLGADVTNTISHGLVDVEDFAETPELLMYGMMCVVASTGLWLLLACYLELPVSTTHSTIGGVIGFAIVAHGWSTVKWYGYDASESALDKFEGVVPIVVSWITSPVLSGILSAVLFSLVRFFILRREDSLERSYMFFPLLVGVACVVNLYYICLVGFDKKKVKHNGDRETISDILGFGWSSLIAWTLSGNIVFVLYYTFIPWLKRKTRKISEPEEEELENAEDSNLIQNEEEGIKKTESWLSMVSSMVDVDVHEAIETDEAVHALHQHSEAFDPATEHCFSYLQVFTAACVSFAHGANDVANSIGPLAAVFAIYKHSRVTEESNVPIWILCLGGVGLVFGLAVYGHTIIRSIGVKLVKVSPARGFAMEFSTATVITFGSIYGIPLSTTHCQVGSTTAVGLLEGSGGVNKILLLKVFGGWVVTIGIVALTTAMFFAQGIYAPSKFNLEALHRYEDGVNKAIEDASLCDPETTQQKALEMIQQFQHDKQDNSEKQIEFLQTIISGISCENPSD